MERTWHGMETYHGLKSVESSGNMPWDGNMVGTEPRYVNGHGMQWDSPMAGNGTDLRK